MRTEKGDSFKSKEIVAKVITDFEYLLKEFKKLSEESAEAGDKGTEAFARWEGLQNLKKIYGC